MPILAAAGVPTDAGLLPGRLMLPDRVRLWRGLAANRVSVVSISSQSETRGFALCRYLQR